MLQGGEGYTPYTMSEHADVSSFYECGFFCKQNSPACDVYIFEKSTKICRLGDLDNALDVPSSPLGPGLEIGVFEGERSIANLSRNDQT